MLLCSCANPFKLIDDKINKALEAPKEDLTYSETVSVPGLQKNELFAQINDWYDNGAPKSKDVLAFKIPSSYEYEIVNVSGQRNKLFVGNELFTTINIGYRQFTEADKNAADAFGLTRRAGIKHDQPSSVPNALQFKLNLPEASVLSTDASQGTINAEYMVIGDVQYRSASKMGGGTTPESIGFNVVYVDVAILVNDEQYKIEITGIDERWVSSGRNPFRGETTWSNWSPHPKKLIDYTGLKAVRASQYLATALQNASKNFVSSGTSETPQEEQSEQGDVEPASEPSEEKDSDTQNNHAQSNDECDAETKKTRAIYVECAEMDKMTSGYGQCTDNYKAQIQKARQACKAVGK
jgi:hypothetical protein